MGLAPRTPAQYESGEPARMSGPQSVGRFAASIINAQPAWQLPMTTGLPSALACNSATRSRKIRPGVDNGFDGLARFGIRRKPDEVAGMAGSQASPISLSALNPPMPGPWPARGSITTKGRLRSSTTVPAGGMIFTIP